MNFANFHVFKSATGEDAAGYGMNEFEARIVADNFSSMLKEAFEVRNEEGKVVYSVNCDSIEGLTPAPRDAFYAILSRYIPQETIDQAWQDLREAGVVA